MTSFLLRATAKFPSRQTAVVCGMRDCESGAARTVEQRFAQLPSSCFAVEIPAAEEYEDAVDQKLFTFGCLAPNAFHMPGLTAAQKKARRIIK